MKVLIGFAVETLKSTTAVYLDVTVTRHSDGPKTLCGVEKGLASLRNIRSREKACDLHGALAGP
ncbi:hypothetical protein SERLA73DRAFT_182506, partial [Serpula lacrymans var. lacrymans S7.3]